MSGAESSLVRARHYATGQLVDITIVGEVIASVAPADDPAGTQALWVAPALFDLQVNGCQGRNFASATLSVEDVAHVVCTLQHHGVSGLLPTLVTSSRAALAHGFRTLRQACESDPVVARAVPGFHLEGPYISPEDGPRGAHPREHVRPADYDEFRSLQDAAGGRIKLLTLAPESPGAIPFIEKVAREGVVVAIGHTGASAPQVREAIRAGARLSTHLGNGSHAVLPRHDNYVWEQLAADELWASLITDGHHLPAPVVKCVLRVKGTGRVILTCDASSLAGLPPGRYTEWGQQLEVLPGGKVVVAGTPYLAGSGVFTDECVSVMQRFTGCTLEEAIDMASARPRQLLGLPVPTLAAGQPADLVLFEHALGADFQVRRVVLAGRVVGG